MRLAFIKHKWVATGGGERYLARLVEGAAAAGHDVHLVAAGWDTGEAGGPTLHRVPVRGVTRASRARAFARGVEDCLERERFDLVCSLERAGSGDVWRAGEGVHEVWLRRRRAFEPPLRNRVATSLPAHRVLRDLEARTVRRSRHVIANSDMVREDLLATYGSAAPEISVIRNGVDPDRFSPGESEDGAGETLRELGCDPERPVLFFLGSGFLRKGLRETLAALARLSRAQLLVAGRDRPAPWAKRASRLGVADRVHFLGPVADPVSLHRAVDLLVLPTWFDPFPNVALEALFCGTPVVTTRYGGAAEVVEEPLAGRVVPTPADLDALAAAIEEQLAIGRTPERNRGIAASVAGYTMEANVRETIALLHRLAARGEGRSGV